MCPIKADKIVSVRSYCFSAIKWVITSREFIFAALQGFCLY